MFIFTPSARLCVSWMAEHCSSPVHEAADLPPVVLEEHNGRVEQHHCERVVEQAQEVDRVRTLAQHKGDQRPLRHVLRPSSEVVDLRSKEEGHGFDAEEDELCWSLATVSGEELVEGRVDVEVTGGISDVSSMQRST